MSNGINKVILIGRLGADPETRFFDDGSAVTNASIATSESWKDKQTGEKKERTEWHRLVFRDRGNYRLAQTAGEYLRTGSQVYVEGSLRTRKWQDQSGQDRYTTEVHVDTLQMLGGGEQGGAKPAAQAAADPVAPSATPAGGDFEDTDSIPF